MRFVFASILSTLIFLATFQSGLMLIDYQINKEYYEALCINKDKPTLDCHGKCELKKETEKQSNQNQLIKISFEVNVLPQQSLTLPKKKILFPVLKEKIFNSYKTFVLSGHTQAPIQPPQNQI